MSEQQQEFRSPFCDQAEVHFWLSITEQLIFQHVRRQGYLFNSADIKPILVVGDDHGKPQFSHVYWQKFYEFTGFCTTGPLAGRLVEWEPYHWYKPRIAHATRPLALDGAGFNIKEGFVRLSRHEFDSDVVDSLQQILVDQEENFYPKLLVAGLKSLGFPIDEQQFLGNSAAANLRYNTTQTI